jgi:mannose/fructose/N-acetylgalactosamine-specific phosphotransferase system component IIC
MTLRDIFGLIVRAIGVALIAAGLIDAGAAPFYALGLVTRPYTSPLSTAVGAISYLFAGLIIFLAARWFVRLAYGPPTDGR